MFGVALYYLAVVLYAARFLRNLRMPAAETGATAGDVIAVATVAQQVVGNGNLVVGHGDVGIGKGE
ncbi:MAG: hypothetical protein JNG88_09775 [Phycisphaerales bacterium]|nr:hypothetical protein [Phycisphaerales bacterium]